MKLSLLSLLLLVSALRLPAQSWERLGPEGGMVVSLAGDPGGELYLGTNDGHIFASQDRGAHWKLLGRVGTRTDAVVAQLAVNAKQPRSVFAAVWFREVSAGGGVFRSDDGGGTWRPCGLQGEAVRALEFAPSRPETLVAGTRSGVFRSPDAAGTWERISPSDDPELRNVDSVAVDPTDPLIIYAGTYHLPWKTTDGGKTWKSIAAGLIDDSDIMSMRVDAANPARIYLSACSGIYRSENRGGLWTKLQGVPYAARRTQAIVQDPRHPATLYAATTEGLWLTRDTGESWERTTPREWVVNGVAVLPPQGTAPARVIIGTETQGVLTSEDAGKSFAVSNQGFTHQVAKQLAGDPRDSSHLALLLERNGVELLESHDAGKTWSPLPAAARESAKPRGWSADQIDRVYGSPWGWMAALSNRTLSIDPGPGANWQPWIATYAPPVKAQKKRAPKTVPSRRAKVTLQGRLAFSADSAYLPASQGVLRCGRTGACEMLPAFSRSKVMSALWVSPDGQLLAISSGGKIGLSLDSGKSAVWRDLPGSVPDANAILWDSEARSILFLATDRGLYFSRDLAEHWTLSQGGLPAAVVEHVGRSEAGLLATLQQGGVYTSMDGTGNWTRLDQDAERGRMNGIVETQSGQFVFGSQSEGVLKWENRVAP